MRLQIHSNCRADGRHLSMGEVADLPQGVANELLALGMASIAPEPEPEPAPDLSMGEVADLPQGVANELLALGMASIAPEPEPEPAPACPPKPRRSAKTFTPAPTPTPED